jgi:hypothetical protein
MKVTLAETADKLHTHQIFALCDYLTSKALDPFFVRQGVVYDRQFEEFFCPAPGCNPYEPTGLIHFFPPPMFAGQLGEMENAIRAALAEAKIKVGPFGYEYFPDGRTVKTVVIAIVENPNALSGPPEVVMSDIAARLVLRDVLGYQEKNGRFDLESQDLLQRVEGVTEDHVLKCSSSPLRDPNPKAPRRVRSTPSPVVAGMIHRCLGELRGFAQWAATNNYRKVRVA